MSHVTANSSYTYRAYILWTTKKQCKHQSIDAQYLKSLKSIVSAVQPMSLLRGCIAPINFHQNLIMHNAINNACAPPPPPRIPSNTINTIASEEPCEYNYGIFVNDVMLKVNRSYCVRVTVYWRYCCVLLWIELLATTQLTTTAEAIGDL